MKIKQYMAIALMGLVLAACNKPDKGGGPDTPGLEEGKTAKLRLSFALPDKITTYAEGSDNNATTAEARISILDIFVYEDGGSFALDYFRFPNSDFPDIEDAIQRDDPDNNIYNLLTELSVRPGTKQVYVGINLPDHIVNRLKAGHYINEPYATTVGSSDALIGNGGSGNIAFFNRTFNKNSTGVLPFGRINVVDVEPVTGADFSVQVDRLVAKIAVTMNEDFENSLYGGSAEKSVSGGTFLPDEFSFTIGQRNRFTYVTPLLNDEDPNYSIASVGNIETPATYQLVPGINPDVNNWVDVNTYTYVNTTGPDWLGETTTAVVYTPENTIETLNADPTTATHQVATYVSVQAKFRPDVIDAGGPRDPNGDFWAVFTGNDDDRGMGQRYFTSYAAAEAYVMSDDFVVDILGETSGDLDDPDDAEEYIHFYEEGYCYYRLYLNPHLNYSILRNNIYVATITGINYIGTTGPDVLPGSENTPTNPNGVPNAIIPDVTFPVSHDDLIQNLQRGDLLSGDIRIVDWVSGGANDQDYELQ